MRIHDHRYIQKLQARMFQINSSTYHTAGIDRPGGAGMTHPGPDELVVRDGESATKFVEASVENAASFISTPALVEMALYGEDINIEKKYPDFSTKCLRRVNRTWKSFAVEGGLRLAHTTHPPIESKELHIEGRSTDQPFSIDRREIWMCILPILDDESTGATTAFSSTLGLLRPIVSDLNNDASHVGSKVTGGRKYSRIDHSRSEVFGKKFDAKTSNVSDISQETLKRGMMMWLLPKYIG
ncbi:hypothetical protein EDC04DRAFT_3094839 [Pisolithus marmoratus]|nr:hypothetical protein EDC04DRAFT_3094839 [Pisolithus marmoratus]